MKSSILCVGCVPNPPRLKQKFEMFENKTSVEADLGPLPTAKMELLNLVPSSLLVGVLGVAFGYNGIS